MDMEQLFTHNLVKTEFTVVLGALRKGEELGYFFSDCAPDQRRCEPPHGTGRHVLLVRRHRGQACRSGGRNGGRPRGNRRDAHHGVGNRQQTLGEQGHESPSRPLQACRHPEYWLVDARKARCNSKSSLDGTRLLRHAAQAGMVEVQSVLTDPSCSKRSRTARASRVLSAYWFHRTLLRARLNPRF